MLLYGVEILVGGFPIPLTLFVFLGFSSENTRLRKWNKVFCNIKYKHGSFVFSLRIGRGEENQTRLLLIEVKKFVQGVF